MYRKFATLYDLGQFVEGTTHTNTDKDWAYTMCKYPKSAEGRIALKTRWLLCQNLRRILYIGRYGMGKGK